MPEFSYKVKDRAGNTRTGTLLADSERHAAAMIREAGGLPMEIKLARGSSPQEKSELAGNVFTRTFVHPFFTGVNIRQLVFFYRQLVTLLAGGVSLSESLRSIGNRSRGALGRIVMAAQQRVQSGGRLTEELARHPRIFLPLQLSLMRAGEQGGLLEPMTDRIASYLEYELSIRQRIAKATFYPILVLLAIIMKPVIIAWAMLSSSAALSVFYSQLRLFVLPLIIVVVMLKFLMQFEPVRYGWDLIKIQPPIIGMVARKIAMSRFSRALAMLYSAGLPMTQALSISADACANVAIGRKLKAAVPAVGSGERLTDALRKTGMVLPMVLDMMAVGDQTGKPDTVLQKVADYMDSEADATINKLSVLLFVLMIIVVGILVAADAIRMFGGYANLLGGAGG